MKIIRTIRNRWHFHSRTLTSYIPILICKSLGPKWTTPTRIFISPIDISGAMIRKHIISISNHMINYSISINPDIILSTFINHLSKLRRSSHSGIEFITNRLIKPIPWIELPILRMLKVQNRLLRGIYFYPKISCFSQHLTLFSNIFIRPSKHLYYSPFLTVFIIIRQTYFRMVPNKI